MFVLPDALAPLSAFPQFIVYRLAPSATRPGKTDKLPVDWRTGHEANAHTPAIWLDAAKAGAIAEAWTVTNSQPYGVGYVLTPNDPFSFIDIDNCYDGTWSASARELLGRFAGAAVEVSVSGKGLHILCQGKAPPHKTRRRGVPFELYTDNRFVALTGTHASGSAAIDCTAALAALVTDYQLRPEDSDGPPSEWTTEPVAEWRGPTDDAQLIERALRSQSASGAFGGKASFADLWKADADALARAYPDPHRGYDASAADAALAQHLAFWTGKNCERMRALMEQSGLAREKWKREDYLPRTILGAVGRQRDVFATPLAIIPDGPDDGTPQATAAPSDTFCSPTDQTALFRGCVYVSSVHKALIPGGYLLKPDQFRVHFGGRSFPMDFANERVTRNAWEAFTESQCFRSPRADSLCFRPEHPPGAIVQDAGATLANLWAPIDTPCVEGDAGPFLRHIEKLLPDADDRAKLLAYMAALVQHPGKKFQWAPMIQGVKGNGKTLLITSVAHAVGDRYTHFPSAHDLGGGGTKFTAWLQGKLFIGIEEIHTADRREVLEALKPLITNARVEIQGKGQDQITGDNRANFIACSNYKDAVPKTNEERRWAIFYTAQQRASDLTRDGMAGGYFPALWDWFNAGGSAHVTYWLKHHKIPDALNPAVGAHRAPDTSSTREAVEVSIGAVEQEIMEAIESSEPGFAGGWVSSMALDRLLKRIGAERKVSIRKRRELMQDLGYDWHPALMSGRVFNTVMPDGGRPRLYLRAGHIALNETDATRVAKFYETAQATAAQAAQQAEASAKFRT